MNSTGEWAGITEAAEALNYRIGEWNDLGYANPPTPDSKTIPPLGERSAEAIRGGHAAIKVIDEIMRELHAVRSQLITEMRTDEDEPNRRVDAALAEAREATPPEDVAGDDTRGLAGGDS